MGTGGNNVPIIMGEIYEEEYWWRKLTCIEAERIQTLEDNYTAGISNTQRYKSIGNAWSPDTVVVFFRKLKEILESI